ncbi:protein priA [Rhodotorula diobovata]|uniref:Protein priA n=1 Tax=Rhodotorula diobovata TaxID=5288 RepID=A0A5C5FKD3_9BASI|nr:protein priA [Rhodotorula diobovata]
MRFSLAVAALAAIASFSGVEAGKKKKQPVRRTLCPTDEIACPILGSTTYGDAVAHHFSNGQKEVSGVMAGSGGYECVNTAEALDSCGGCASTGEGVDCTKIRGAAGVGCEQGACIVFSCQAGWRPALSGNKCVRARASHNSSAAAAAAASASSNGTQTVTRARRHLNGRHARHAMPMSH